jgi:hypothetical protein
VANKTKQQERDRRAKIEAMRKAEQAKERRKSMMFIAIAVVVGLGLIAAAAVPAYLESRNDPANKALSTFGVSKAAADCDAVQTSKGTNNEEDRNHVEDGTTEDYATVPPSYGPHWAAPVFPAREFYTARDRPEMEQLVHNLEHGYTILWYDTTIKGNQLAQLKDIAASARNDDATGPNGKFIVSAWDDTYGDFPTGKHIGLSHWGSADSFTQVCGKVSGDVVADFIDKHPASDAPEANAA